jgi:hypothetical protein
MSRKSRAETTCGSFKSFNPFALNSHTIYFLLCFDKDARKWRKKLILPHWVLLRVLVARNVLNLQYDNFQKKKTPSQNGLSWMTFLFFKPNDQGDGHVHVIVNYKCVHIVHRCVSFPAKQRCQREFPTFPFTKIIFRFLSAKMRFFLKQVQKIWCKMSPL